MIIKQKEHKMKMETERLEIEKRRENRFLNNVTYELMSFELMSDFAKTLTSLYEIKKMVQFFTE